MKRARAAGRITALALLTTVAQGAVTAQVATPAPPVTQDTASSGQATTTTQTETGLGDIVVTARRRNERIDSTPVAIKALTAEDLANKSVVNVADLTRTTAGLNVATTGTKTQPTISLRGQRRSPIGTGAPTVIIYFADVPLPNAGGLIPTYDLASIQVLKGPQGTLFGRNTTGGAILVTPAAASYDFGGYATIRAGSYSQHAFEGAVNVPIVSDKVALRVAGLINRRDGYTKSEIVGDDLDDEHNESVRATLRLDPAPGFASTTIFDYYHANEAGNSAIPYGLYPNATSGGGSARLAALAPFFTCGTSVDCDIDLQKKRQDAAGVRRSFANMPGAANIRLLGATNTTTYTFGDVTLKNILAYRQARVGTNADLDGTSLSIIGQNSQIGSGQISDEAQVSGKALDHKLDYILGFFYVKESPEGINQSTSTTLARPGAAPPTAQATYRRSNSKAVYGQISYDLGALVKGVKIDLGGRYTWDESSGCFLAYSSTLPTPSQSTCTANGTYLSSKSKAPTWTAGINWQASNALYLYFVARHGYRAGGYNSPSLGALLQPFQQIEPEKVTDFEIGAKAHGRLAGMAYRATIAAYRGRYSGVQRNYTLAPNFDGDNNAGNDPAGGLIVNSGVARLQGVEVEATIKPFRDLTLSANGAYTDIHYLSVTLPALFASAGLIPPNTIDNKFPYAPRYSYTVSADYVHPISHALGNFALSADYYWSDHFWFQERPAADVAVRAPSYGVVNLRVGLQDIGGRGIDAMFVARNLFDKIYVTGNGAAATTLTVTSAVYGPPRMLGVELKARF